VRWREVRMEMASPTRDNALERDPTVLVGPIAEDLALLVVSKKTADDARSRSRWLSSQSKTDAPSEDVSPLPFLLLRFLGRSYGPSAQALTLSVQ
jgi:hypothetical protein